MRRVALLLTLGWCVSAHGDEEPTCRLAGAYGGSPADPRPVVQIQQATVNVADEMAGKRRKDRKRFKAPSTQELHFAALRTLATLVSVTEQDDNAGLARSGWWQGGALRFECGARELALYRRYALQSVVRPGAVTMVLKCEERWDIERDWQECRTLVASDKDGAMPHDMAWAAVTDAILAANQ